MNDFLAKGLKGRSKTTIDNYRSLADRNLIPQIGGVKLKELTADQVDDWLDERAEDLTTRTLRLIHQILERAIRQAQASDKIRRNVASLVDMPEGREGRPSKAMTLNQAVMLLETVESGTHRLAAYVVLSLLSGSAPRRPGRSRGTRWPHQSRQQRPPDHDEPVAVPLTTPESPRRRDQRVPPGCVNCSMNPQVSGCCGILKRYKPERVPDRVWTIRQISRSPRCISSLREAGLMTAAMVRVPNDGLGLSRLRTPAWPRTWKSPGRCG